VKHGISSVVLVIAIVFAMSGWICALGWVAFKLFEFV
jgi:preprotein translocase subunit SecE